MRGGEFKVGTLGHVDVSYVSENENNKQGMFSMKYISLLNITCHPKNEINEYLVLH